MSALNKPLSQTLTPKRSNNLAYLMLALGVLIALGAAIYGYLQQARVERVVIALRPIPFGHQIVAEDLGTIEVPLHRPIQLAGITNPAAVIGSYAAREIGPNDLLQDNMLSRTPPDEPVYPNGEVLQKNMVPLPFSIQTIGPLTHHDVVNLGFSDPSGDPALCGKLGGEAATPSMPELQTGQAGRPYACRLLSSVEVLYIDELKGIAYLEVTPYQAHVVWSLFASGLTLWGERYGVTSDPLPPLTRIDPSQISPDLLTAPATTTLQLGPGRRTLPGGPAPTVTGAK